MKPPSSPAHLLRTAAAASAALLALGGAPRAARAQQTGPDVRNEVFVGSEVESYLRVLQVVGKVPLYPWTVRDFSPAEVERLLPVDSAHPWARHYGLAPDSSHGAHVAWVRPGVRLIGNSSVPYGDNDGAVWAGRGATAVVEGGFSARAGILSLTVDPIAFITQNASFKLAANGRTGPQRFADAQHGYHIDMPQRFGDGSYGRIDPGQSTLRADWHAVAAGVSTANQEWGPAMRFPLILGNNAAGFAHVFVGTAHPVGIGIGTVQGRILWGRLSQTEYASSPPDSSLRLGSGFAMSFTPRGVPGLELGVSRFFHSVWPGSAFGLHDLTRPLQGVLKSHLKVTGQGSDDRSDADNQLASAFFRWVFPASGMEVYGEYGRDDHNFDTRDLLLEPDHISAYLVGLHRVWTRSDGTMVALRGEVANARITQMDRARPQAVFYVHSFMRAGHTQLGQVLGSPALYGGAGATLGLDRYDRHGRLSFSWTRTIRREPTPIPAGSAPKPERLDVVHSLGFDGVFFHRYVDLTAGVAGVYEINRDFQKDKFNMNGTVGARFRL